MDTQKTMSRNTLKTANPRLFRVVIHVWNLEEAQNFYSTLLNIKGRRVSPGRHYFQTNDITLALYDAVKEAHFHKGPIPEHLYFAVENLEEVYERAKKLNCLSTEMIQDENAGEIVTRAWGERSFYVVDPYNNGLCFVDSNTLITGNE
jgi:predicted enzyme related to lactoylglutathione lyase